MTYIISYLAKHHNVCIRVYLVIHVVVGRATQYIRVALQDALIDYNMRKTQFNYNSL